MLFTSGNPKPVLRVSCLLQVAMLTLLGGCGLLGPAPSPPVQVAAPPLPPSAEVMTPSRSSFDTLGLVAYAASMQGKPYRISGNSPVDGFDCSGLVQHVFGLFDLALPRNAEAMAGLLPPVAIDRIEAADLLFFDTQGQPFSHVGIYLGDGRFVHAPSPRTGRVIISRMENVYWRHRLTGARRPRQLTLAARAD